MEYWAKMGKSYLQYICAKSWFPTMRFVFCKKKLSNFGLIEPRGSLSDMSGKQVFLKIKKNYTAASILVFIFGIKLQFSDQLIMVFLRQGCWELIPWLLGTVNLLRILFLKHFQQKWGFMQMIAFKTSNDICVFMLLFQRQRTV